MTITLRRATADELDKLTALALCSKQSNGYDDDFMAACKEELTVTPERFSSGEYWVAEHRQSASNESGSGTVDRFSLCGCACLVIDNATASAEVHAFFIDPAWQRQGVGRQLWQRLLTRAKQQNLTSIYLDADPQAVPFYSAMGFEEIGRSPSGSIAGRYLPKMEMKL